MNKKVLSCSLLFLISLIIVLLIDYYNVFSFITIRLNSSFLEIIINSLTVLFIFFISYFLIDKKITDNEKEKRLNQKNACIILLNQTYIRCLDGMKTLDSNLNLYSKLEEKFSHYNNYEEMYLKLLENVFVFDEKIFNFITDGTIDDDFTSDYLSIKNYYNDYVVLKSSLYMIGADKVNDESFKELDDIEKDLNSRIRKSLSKTKKYK